MSRWLAYVAALAFAAMAALAAAEGAGAAGTSGVMCSASPHAAPLTGMVSMYVLMSVVHAGPWWRLARRSWRGAVRVPSPRHEKGRRSALWSGS